MNYITTNSSLRIQHHCMSPQTNQNQNVQKSSGAVTSLLDSVLSVPGGLGEHLGGAAVSRPLGDLRTPDFEGHLVQPSSTGWLHVCPQHPTLCVPISGESQEAAMEMAWSCPFRSLQPGQGQAVCVTSSRTKTQIKKCEGIWKGCRL